MWCSQFWSDYGTVKYKTLYCVNYKGRTKITLWTCKIYFISQPWSAMSLNGIQLYHDDIIKWKHFPCYRPFMQGIQQSLMDSPHKGQWWRALMFSLTCVWINGWVNNREAGDLRCYHAHYEVSVMSFVKKTVSYKVADKLCDPMRFGVSEPVRKIEELTYCGRDNIDAILQMTIIKIPTLFLIMAWRREPGNKPLSEPVMVRSLTHICVTRPQWFDFALTQCCYH